jgi:phosphoglycerate dehydrogenase-like enzyme
MRIGLADIMRPQAARLRPHLDPADEIVDVADGGTEPLALDVLIASRVSAADAARIRFRLLQVPGAGTDKIALDAVPGDAWICNAYEHEGPIAEYVFAAMLDFSVGFGALARAIPDKGWGAAYFARAPHGELAGKTVGIIGFGHIGRAIAGRARAFGMRVMAIAARERPSDPDADWIATPSRLPELLAAADFLVLACPLNDATRGIIDAAALVQMKPSAVLINVARAEVADEAALYDALVAGTIGGAVLDPWYRYPASAADPVEPSRFPFAALPTVRMTPHSAAWTDGVWERRHVVFAQNIARLKAGQPLLNIVRPASPA